MKLFNLSSENTDLASITNEALSKNIYFVYNHQKYIQLGGGPMGSSLSLEIANLFVEYLEHHTLEQSTSNRACSLDTWI